MPGVPLAVVRNHPGRRPSRTALTIALFAAAFVLDLTMWSGGPTLRWGGELPLWVLVASGLLTYGGLAVLRGRTGWAFCVALAYTVFWGVTLPEYQPFTALTIALFDAARRLPLRAALPFVVGCVPAWALNTANAATLVAMDAAGVAVTAALWGVITSLTWMAGRSGFRAEENARLREEALATRARLARQEDRLALSQELHDVLSHSMGAIALQAAGARAVAAGEPDSDARVLAALEAIQSTSTSSMQELRRLLGLLAEGGARAADDTGVDFVELGRLDAIGGLVRSTRACGVTVRLDARGRPFPLAADQDHAAYRFVQEGLANALRHGGRGSHVDVVVAWGIDELELRLSSTAGAGRDAALRAHGSGRGLRGLEGRVTACGGLFAVEPGEVFTIRATLPRRRPVSASR